MGKRLIFCLAILIMMLLTSCTTGDGFTVTQGEEVGIVLDDEEITLKVMYYQLLADDEPPAPDNSLKEFQKKYPQVKIELIKHNLYSPYQIWKEDPDHEELRDLIENERPDIIQLSETFYKQYAELGTLEDLMPYMTKDQYDTAGLVSGLLDYMGGLVEGDKLYGLPYSFFSPALYYHKPTFEEYGVPYPEDQMTWQNVLDIAKQFPADLTSLGEKRFSLALETDGSLWGIATYLAETEGISYVDSVNQQMTINTQQWNNVIQLAIEIAEMDQIGHRSDFTDPRRSREPVMQLNSSSFAYNSKRNGYRAWSNYDLVTAPVSSQYPDQGSNFKFNDILTIASYSQHKDAAWKFIAYMTGEEHSEFHSNRSFSFIKDDWSLHANYGTFLARTSYVKNLIRESHNYEAIYKLKPTPWGDDVPLPEQFETQFYTEANDALEGARIGAMTIEEALEYLQQRGEELLALK